MESGRVRAVGGVGIEWAVGLRAALAVVARAWTQAKAWSIWEIHARLATAAEG